MKHFFLLLIAPVTENTTEIALLLMRVGIGILTIGHGIPKIMGGVSGWTELGAFMHPMGIYFLPIMWGFLGAATEFFGGIMLTCGIGSRIASACLIFMMIVATVWHLSRGDSYNFYSFPLSLIFVYLCFLIIGGGKFSLDSYIFNQK